MLAMKDTFFRGPSDKLVYSKQEVDRVVQDITGRLEKLGLELDYDVTTEERLRNLKDEFHKELTDIAALDEMERYFALSGMRTVTECIDLLSAPDVLADDMKREKVIALLKHMHDTNTRARRHTIPIHHRDFYTCTR